MDRQDAARKQDLTTEQRQRLARDRRWRVWVLVIAAVLAVVGLVAGGLLLHSQHPQKQVRWGLLVVIAISVLVFTAGITAVAWRVRSKSTSLERLVVSGDPATIRRVRRSLGRGEPVAADDLEVARALVAQSRSQRWLPWFFGVSGVLYLSNLVVSLRHEPMATILLVLRAATGVAFILICLASAVGRRRLLRGAERAGLPTDA